MAKKTKFYSEGLGLVPVSTDPSSPAQGQMQYSDGTARTEGVWVYDGTNWIAAVTETAAAKYTTNAGQAIAAATPTTIICEDLVFDTDSIYNSGTGIATIPSGLDGKYIVIAAVATGNTSYTAADTLGLDIQKNGASASGSSNFLRIPLTLSTSYQVIASSVIDLVATDTVEAVCTSTRAFNVATTQFRTYFSIIKVGN